MLHHENGKNRFKPILQKEDSDTTSKINTTNAVITFFPTGEVENINPSAQELLGSLLKIPPSDINSILNIIPDDQTEFFEKQLKRTLSGANGSREIFVPGKENDLSLYLIPVFDNNGRITMVKAVLKICSPKPEGNTATKTNKVFEPLFENHPDAVYSFDLEGKFLSANASAAEIAEMTIEELLATTFEKLIAEEDLARVFSHFEKAAKGEVQQYNTGFISFKGTRRIINVTNFPIIADNEIKGVFGIAKDITELEENKKKVKESQQRYKNILDQSLDIICTVDKDGRFVEVSAACSKMLGYQPEELIGRKNIELIHPADVEISKAAGREIEQGDEKTSFTNRCIRKEGSYVRIIWSAKWEENEKLMYCVGKDASEIQKAQKQLVRERNMLRAIIDNIPDYIFVVDKDHKTILSNKKFYSDYLGGTDEKVTLNLKPSDYFPEQEGLEVMKNNQKVMDTGVPVINRQDIVFTHQGKKEVLSLTKVPLKTNEGGTVGLVGIGRDITDRFNFEQEQKLVHRLLTSLNKASDLRLGLKTTILLIAEFLNFHAAEAWEVGYDKNFIRKIADFNSGIFFEGKLDKFEFNKGLPGITWKNETVQVWENLQNDRRFQRKTAIKQKGSSFAIGVPIVDKKKVISVLTFFGSQPDQTKEKITELLQRLALQISTDIQRKITEDHLNNMFEHSPNLIAVIGTDGYLKKINPAFNRIFGYSEKQLLTTPFQEFLHPDEASITFERLKEVAGGRKPHAFENRCLAKDGEYRWISWIPSALIEEEGIVNLFGIDITQLKSTNLELKKYKNIIESSKQGIGLFTVDNQEIFLNRSLKEVLGYSDSEVLELKSFEDFYAEKEIAGSIYSLLFSGRYWEGDIKLKNKKGEILDFHLSSGPILNNEGELLAVFGIHTDNKERKAHEAALINHSNQVNNILESIKDGFFSLTHDGKVTYWNKEAENLTRITRNEIVDRNLWENLPNVKNLLFDEKYEEVIKTGKKSNFEEYFETLNRWFDISIYPGNDGTSIFFRDITSRKQIDEEVRIAKERYDLVSKATREAIYDWDIKKNFLEWSEAYYANFGYKELSGEETIENWKERLHPQDVHAVVSDLEEMLNSSDKFQWDCEYRLVKENGETAIVMEKGHVIRDEAGNPVRMIGSLQDITELKQDERALEELNYELEKNIDELAVSNAELEQFAYIASHDLQEPLRMVTSFLSQLQKKYEGQLDSKAQQYIHFAADGAVRMRKIINDLLEYSRVGKLNYQLEEIDMNKLLQEIVQLYENSIRENGAVIHFDGLPVILAAKTPIQRVLSNLISNAIKYKKEDVAPVIQVLVEDETTHWKISVKDNGIGIDENFYQKIFIIFQRLHAKDEFSGTGIGLAICKKIVENHGGKIWLESEPGKGSTFHFTINQHF